MGIVSRRPPLSSASWNTFDCFPCMRPVGTRMILPAARGGRGFGGSVIRQWRLGLGRTESAVGVLRRCGCGRGPIRRLVPRGGRRDGGRGAGGEVGQQEASAACEAAGREGRTPERLADALVPHANPEQRKVRPELPARLQADPRLLRGACGIQGTQHRGSGAEDLRGPKAAPRSQAGYSFPMRPHLGPAR